jgi:hypothetical protein
MGGEKGLLDVLLRRWAVLKPRGGLEASADLPTGVTPAVGAITARWGP